VGVEWAINGILTRMINVVRGILIHIEVGPRFIQNSGLWPG